MKKIIAMLVSGLLMTAALTAASFNIHEQRNIELDGVKKIVFELKPPHCALCISTGRQSYNITGGGPSGTASLSLEGEMSSNNKKAVPSLYIDRKGDTLTVRMYEDNNLYFGLVQTGSAYFSAVLPDYFEGDIDIISSSGDTSVSGITALNIKAESSSGDVSAESIDARGISLRASSGDVTGRNLSADGDIIVRSSSGDVELNRLQSGSFDASASSGKILATDVKAAGEIKMHASSGRVTAEKLDGKTVSIDANSGKISIKDMAAGDSSIEASSGDIAVSGMNSENAYFRASSGRISIDVVDLSGDINVKSSSGDVDISLPAGTGFDADLSASSGKIKSTFRLLGEVTGSSKNEVVGTANGGGHRVRVNASSGDISIEER